MCKGAKIPIILSPHDVLSPQLAAKLQACSLPYHLDQGENWKRKSWESCGLHSRVRLLEYMEDNLFSQVTALLQEQDTDPEGHQCK